MVSERLDPGIYTNIFPVQIPYATVEVMTAPARVYSSLRDLREHISALSRNLRVYRFNDVVFGYGSDLDWLADKRFERKHVHLHDHPKWCTRMIVEGLSDLLKKQNYREWTGRGRITLYEPQPFRKAAQDRLCIFRGYDLRAIYWHRDQQPLFGLIVDICWEIRDINDNRLNTSEIAEYRATAEIALIQEEYLPGNRINPEVSRMRLQNHILPFVQQINRFALPCSVRLEATLSSVPVRVILGV